MTIISFLIYRLKTWYIVYVTFETHVIFFPRVTVPTAYISYNVSQNLRGVSTRSLQVQFLENVSKRTIKPR